MRHLNVLASRLITGCLNDTRALLISDLEFLPRSSDRPPPSGIAPCTNVPTPAPTPALLPSFYDIGTVTLEAVF